MIDIYKASAGSGKTFTLAREYIKFILGHKNEQGLYELNRPGSTPSGHRNVLAMTFTNKATEEMKSRIIHELAVLAGCERDWEGKSPYEDELCRVFRCTSEALGVAAKDALRSLLYDFSRFSISTIDSFFQMVLRSFAHEADVSANYALELDDREVITMSVDQLLQSLNHSRPTRRSREIETWITGYMKSLIENGNSFTLFNRSGNVHDDLINFIGAIHNDTFKDNEARIMDYLADSDRFHQFCSTVFDRISEIKKNTAEVCRATVGYIESRPEISDIVSSVGLKIVKAWSESGWKKYDSVPKTIRSVIEDPSSIWKVAAKKNSKKSAFISPEVEAMMETAMLSIEKCIESVSLLEIIRGNLYQLGLVNALMELIDRFRRENSTLLLSDTNSLLAKIIGDEDSPFLYEKLGTRYHNYLIDEFQDTSLSQWYNMRPLLRESLAYDYDSLVIGDEKQCIYRFRNSDPSLLHNLHREDWAEGNSLVRGDSITENTNWRSSAEVVNFNNSLFVAISRLYGFDDVYSNVVQQVSSKHCDHHGYVRVKFFDSESYTEDSSLEVMAREMRRQLSSGYSPCDIAVLVRNKKEGAKVIRYLEALMASDENFPKFDIISEDSLLISRSDAVVNIISRLRMLSDVDVVSDKRKRSSREIAVMLDGDKTIHASGIAPDKALLSAIERMKKRADGGDGNEDAGGSSGEALSLHGIDLVSLVESIISTRLSPAMRESESVYIAAFVDLVVKFVGQGHADIRSFLQWWDDAGSRKASISGSSEARAINVLTAHKSKGLEFPCVHIPFGEMSAGKSGGDLAWFELPCIPGIPDDILPPMMPLTVSSSLSVTSFAEQYAEIRREELLDKTNLLYVAFTRAIDELIIGVKLSKSDRGALGDGKKVNVSRILYEGITSGGDKDYMPLSLDDDMEFRVGSPTCRQISDSRKGTAMHPAASELMVAYESTSVESVWQNTNVDAERLNRIEVARERGLILHGLMSHIRRAEDVDTAFRLLRGTPDARRLTSRDFIDLRDIVDARVSDPRAKNWYEGFDKVYMERELLTASGEISRVDRVVWTADGEVHVIDYKTGSQDPKRYKRQVNGYMQFFRSIGCPCVRGFLYYLDSGDIVEL